MLNLKYLPYGESSVSLVKTIPQGYGDITSLTPTILVEDVYGTELLAETSTGVTKYDASVTTGTAVSRGATSITLTGTPTALVVGRIYRILKTGETSEDFEVTAYDSSTKIATIAKPLEYSHASGASIVGRWIAYTLNISVTGTFPDLKECVITWGGLWPAGMDLTDQITIRKKIVAFSGLHEEFGKRFRRYEELIPDGAWDQYETDARKEWRRMFWTRDRDFDTLMESTDVHELMSIEIARQIALVSGNEFIDELAKFEVEKLRLFEMFNAQRYWFDVNDDAVRDDEEFNKAVLPPPRRRLR